LFFALFNILNWREKKKRRLKCLREKFPFVRVEDSGAGQSLVPGALGCHLVTGEVGSGYQESMEL
jgi:hypothetical protein